MGDQISNQLKIITRNKSAVTIQFGIVNYLTINSNSKVFIRHIPNEAKILTRIISGSLHYENRSQSQSELFISGKSSANYLSSHSFDSAIHNGKFYFKNIGTTKVSKYRPITVGKKDPLEITNKELEALINNTKKTLLPTYTLKKNKSRNRKKIPQIKKASKRDIISLDRANHVQNIPDSSPQKSEFHSKKQKKSKRENNIGVQLED